MMRKIILLTLLIGIFLVSLIAAQNPCGNENSFLGTFQQNQEIQLKQTCDSCTFVNITAISYPNGTTINHNVAMTKSGVNYNYLFNNTNSLSCYSYDTLGDKDSSIAVETIDFMVTPNGKLQSTSQGIGSAMYLVLMIILMFTFGIMGYKLVKTKNLWVLGIFFMFFSSLLMVYNVWLGYEYHRTFTGLENSGTPEIIFYIFLTLVVLGLLTSMALLFLRWKEVFKYVKKEMKRKEPNDEDTEDWDIDKWGGKEYGR